MARRAGRVSRAPSTAATSSNPRAAGFNRPTRSSTTSRTVRDGASASTSQPVHAPLRRWSCPEATSDLSVSSMKNGLPRVQSYNVAPNSRTATEGTPNVWCTSSTVCSALSGDSRMTRAAPSETRDCSIARTPACRSPAVSAWVATITSEPPCGELWAWRATKCSSSSEAGSAHWRLSRRRRRGFRSESRSSSSVKLQNIRALASAALSSSARRDGANSAGRIPAMSLPAPRVRSVSTGASRRRSSGTSASANIA